MASSGSSGPKKEGEDRLREMEMELQMFISNNLRKQDILELKETLKYDIPPAKMEKCNDFNDLWSQLFRRGLLKLGCYDYLKQRCDAVGLVVISKRIEEIQGYMKKMNDWSPVIHHENIVDEPTFYEQLSDLTELKRVRPSTTLDQINHPNAVAAIASQDRDRALHLKDKFSLLIPKQAVQGWLVVYCHFDFSNGLMTEDNLLRYEPPGQDIVWYGVPITCGPTPHQFQHPVNIALGHCAVVSERFQVETLEIYLKRVDGNFEPIGPKKCIFQNSGFVIIETDHFSTYCLGLETTKTQVLPELKLAVLSSIRGSAETGLYIDLMVVLDSEYMVQMACENALATRMEASFCKTNRASFLAKPSVDLVLVVTDGSHGTPNTVTIPQQVLKNLAFKPVLLSKTIVKSGNDRVCGVVIQQEEPVFAFNILPKTYKMKEVSSRFPSPSAANTQADGGDCCFAPTSKFGAPSPCTGQAIEVTEWCSRPALEIYDEEYSHHMFPIRDTMSTCSFYHNASYPDAMMSEQIFATIQESGGRIQQATDEGNPNEEVQESGERIKQATDVGNPNEEVQGLASLELELEAKGPIPHKHPESINTRIEYSKKLSRISARNTELRKFGSERLLFDSHDLRYEMEKKHDSRESRKSPERLIYSSESIDEKTTMPLLKSDGMEVRRLNRLWSRNKFEFGQYESLEREGSAHGKQITHIYRTRIRSPIERELPQQLDESRVKQREKKKESDDFNRNIQMELNDLRTINCRLQEDNERLRQERERLSARRQIMQREHEAEITKLSAEIKKLRT